MGFLDALKKIFAKEEILIVNLNVEQLDSKIEEDIKTTGEDERKGFSVMNDELGASLRGLDISIENLKKGEIKEKVREETRKEIDSYRTEHVRLISDFSDRIKKRIENGVNEEKINSINDEVNLLVKSSARSYFFTRDAFIESRVIHSRIEEIKKNLNNFVEKLAEMKKKIEIYNELKIVLEEYKSLVSFSKVFDDEIKSLEEEIELKKKEIDEQKKKRDELLKSEEYRKGIELINKKRQTESERGIIELRLRDLIDSKLLERYAYQEEDKERLRLIKAYIENPVIAIKDDNELNIMNIFEEIKNAISLDRIEVKKGKKEKTLEKLGFDKKILSELREKLNNFDNEINDINEKTKGFISEEMLNEIERGMIREIGEKESAIELQKEKKIRNEKKISEKRAELEIKTKEVFGKEYLVRFE